jgi:murein DD-endopeptidase MepM/ murein hydrolase activator NlpD
MQSSPNRSRVARLILALLVLSGVVGGAVYLVSLWSAPAGVVIVPGSLGVTPRPPLGSPVAPFALVDPALAPYLEFGQPLSGALPLDVIGEGIPPVGAYLQREPVPPTATPSPAPTLPPQPTERPLITATPQGTLLAAVPTLPPTPSLIPTSPLVATVLAFDATVQAQAQATQAVPVGFCPPDGVPVSGPLTQRFHGRHSGIDIGVPLGSPVFATHTATVTSAEWSEYGYGNLITLQSGNYITYYAHLTSYNVVQGDVVPRGAIIGFSGSTGNSSGPHVHYETRIDDIPVDPLTFEARALGTC